MGFLSSGAFSVALDAASVHRMVALANCAPVFLTYYTAAMNACVNHVVTEAKTNASERFMAPTGTLMRAITGTTVSPWQGVVGVGRQVPYARRREFGFTGMTDALGRTYLNDPGTYYMTDAYTSSLPFIGATYRSAAALAIRTIVI